MNFDEQFELPLNFLEQKKAENTQNDTIDGFIGNLYANYSFEMYKPSKLTQSGASKKKIKQSNKSQNQKRLQNIKNLVRISNLKQNYTLEKNKKEEKQRQYHEKNRIRHRLESNKELQQPHDNFEYINIVNVERPNKPPKRKGVTYVDNNKMNRNDRTDQEGEDCVETAAFGKAYDLVPFGEAYKDQKAMYELNRTIHQKSTYRFNVLWWDKEKKSEIERKKQLEGGNQQRNEASLGPETIKELKKHLRPLRRHKLISTKYAPFSQFMNNYEGLLGKDGIVNGRMIDTSESEQQMEVFKEYDRRLEEQMNPPGTVNLEQPQVKKKRRTKKTTLSGSQVSKKSRKTKDKAERSVSLLYSDDIDSKLRRALRKMKEGGWQEDQILTRGQNQDQPIEIE